MKVLVAGRGFIGTALGKSLEREHEVKYLDRSGGDYRFDITEPFSIEEEFDVLCHTIGLAPGFNSAEQYEKVHVEGTQNLLDAVDSDRVVYVSALCAGEIDHSFFRTKREAEKIVENDGREYVVVRPSTVYAPGNKLLEMIRSTASTRLFPDIRTVSQPITLDNLVELLELVIDSEENAILNAAGPEKYTIGELARIIYAEEGHKCFLVPMSRVVIETGLRLSSFLPPPFERENIQILRHGNSTDRNDAADLIDLDEVV
jgi:NADH dehydrogenase